MCDVWLHKLSWPDQAATLGGSWQLFIIGTLAGGPQLKTFTHVCRGGASGNLKLRVFLDCLLYLHSARWLPGVVLACGYRYEGSITYGDKLLVDSVSLYII